MATPTSRTLDYCRKEEMPCGVVERFSPFSNTRHDLFGCIDLIALDSGPGVLGIQATSTPNVNARVEKAMKQPHLLLWLLRGNRFQVWGWKGYVVKNKDGSTRKAKQWRLRKVEVISVNKGSSFGNMGKMMLAREMPDE